VDRARPPSFLFSLFPSIALARDERRKSMDTVRKLRSLPPLLPFFPLFPFFPGHSRGESESEVSYEMLPSMMRVVCSSFFFLSSPFSPPGGASVKRRASVPGST